MKREFNPSHVNTDGGKGCPFKTHFLERFFLEILKFFLECYKDKYTSEHFVEKFKRAALKKSTFVIFIFTIPFGAFSVSVIFFHLVGQKLWPKLEIHTNKQEP